MFFYTNQVKLYLFFLILSLVHASNDPLFSSLNAANFGLTKTNDLPCVPGQPFPES